MSDIEAIVVIVIVAWILHSEHVDWSRQDGL